MARNLLIVEDDDDISGPLYDAFESKGYLVWRASNGLDAIRTVTREAFRPDVILLDLCMPGMDGREFLSARHEIELIAGCPVVIMSAQPQALDEIEETVFARLIKPVRLDTVVDAVERACRCPPVAPVAAA